MSYGSRGELDVLRTYPERIDGLEAEEERLWRMRNEKGRPPPQHARVVGRIMLEHSRWLRLRAAMVTDARRRA